MTINAPHLGHGRESLLIPMAPFGFDSGAMPGDVVQHVARTSRCPSARSDGPIQFIQRTLSLRDFLTGRSQKFVNIPLNDGDAVWVVGFRQDLKRLKAFLERRHLPTTGMHTFRAQNLVNLRAPSGDRWSKQDSRKIEIRVASWLK